MRNYIVGAFLVLVGACGGQTETEHPGEGASGAQTTNASSAATTVYISPDGSTTTLASDITVSGGSTLGTSSGVVTVSGGSTGKEKCSQPPKDTGSCVFCDNKWYCPSPLASYPNCAPDVGFNVNCDGPCMQCTDAGAVLWYCASPDSGRNMGILPPKFACTMP